MIIEERRAGCWFVFPESLEERESSRIIAMSGPWRNKEAATLASVGKFLEAHKADGT